MTDVVGLAPRQTEGWKTLSWKAFQQNVFRLQKRIYQASLHSHCHDEVHAYRCL